MKKFDAIKQMPLKNFANLIFDVVKREVDTLQDFEKFLDEEVPPECMETVERALQDLQRPQHLD